MKTVWQHSPDLEVYRVLYTCHNISNSFYQDNKFLPLPYPNIYPTQASIILPTLSYTQISRFWSRVGKLSFTGQSNLIPSSLSLPLTTMLTTLNLPTPNTSKIESLWSRLSPNIMDSIAQLFPQIKNIQTLTINFTRYGSALSFSLNHSSNNPHILIWLREDQGIRTIVEGILSALLRPHLTGADWRTTELVIDSLIDNSQLTSIIPPDKTTTPSLTTNKQQPELAKLSRDFLTHIGFPTSHKLDLDTLQHLTPLETKTIHSLQDSYPNILTYDQIADIIFDSDDNYSLGGVTKHIHRLRNKLEKNGFPASLIQTHRGHGYSLSQ